MIEYDLETLVFRENNKVRIFFSKEFNFIFDKDSGLSLSWGEKEDDTPMYDPISPQELNIVVDENFKYLENEAFIKKILNINNARGPETPSLISTVSNINIYLKNNEALNNKEIKELINFFCSYKLNTFLCIQYNSNISMKEVMQLKMLNVTNLILTINDFKSDSLLESLKALLSKNIFVSCKFNLSKNNYNEFLILLNSYPVNTFSVINLVKPNLTKKQKAEIFEKIDSLKINISLMEPEGGFKDDIKIKVKKYDASLFSCYINFIDKQIYPDDQHINKSIKFENVNSLKDYWKSNEFIELRSSLVGEQKYEKNEDLPEELENLKEIDTIEEVSVETIKNN